MDIIGRKRSEVQLIELRGKLVLGQPVDELRKTIDESVQKGDTSFVLNLAAVPTIDSSGIGLLVRTLAAVKQRGGNLKLVQPSPFAAKTLRLVGVFNLFEVFDDDETAIESYA